MVSRSRILSAPPLRSVPLFRPGDGDACQAGDGGDQQAIVLPELLRKAEGVDHFLDKVRSTGIILTGSSGAYGVTIAEHIVMILLEVMRRRPDYIRLKEERKWEQNLPVRSLFGARVTFWEQGISETKQLSG